MVLKVAHSYTVLVIKAERLQVRYYLLGVSDILFLPGTVSGLNSIAILLCGKSNLIICSSKM